MIRATGGARAVIEPAIEALQVNSGSPKICGSHRLALPPVGIARLPHSIKNYNLPKQRVVVEDPKNYRFCGYGAAMGGDLRCRNGILAVMGMTDWEAASARYRIYLMERGHVEAATKKGKVTRELLLETLKQGGQLPRSELLRLRVRYFTDGLVLGTEAFVEDVFQQFRSHFGEKRRSGSRALRGFSGSDLKVVRDLRVDPIS